MGLLVMSAPTLIAVATVAVKRSDNPYINKTGRTFIPKVFIL
jgi:hypothetical protein